MSERMYLLRALPAFPLLKEITVTTDASDNPCFRYISLLPEKKKKKKNLLATENTPHPSILLNFHPKKSNNVLVFGVLRCPPCCQIPRKIATASSVTGPVPCQTSGDRVLAGLCYALSGKQFAGRDHDSPAGDENTKKSVHDWQLLFCNICQTLVCDVAQLAVI